MNAPRSAFAPIALAFEMNENGLTFLSNNFEDRLDASTFDVSNTFEDTQRKRSVAILFDLVT